MSGLLGHYSLTFTWHRYGHLFDEARREAAERMDAMIAERMDKALSGGR